MASHPHPRSSLPALAVGLCVAMATTGCSLLEKEFDTGRSTPRSDLNSDGLSAEQDSGDEWGDRPGGSGTDPDGGSSAGSSGGSGSDGGSGSAAAPAPVVAPVPVPVAKAKAKARRSGSAVEAPGPTAGLHLGRSPSTEPRLLRVGHPDLR